MQRAGTSSSVRKLPLPLNLPCVQFTAFCVYHLWHFDRFRCLRINQGPYSGAFKRVMAVCPCLPTPGLRTKQSPQYTYLLTLPLLTTYSVGNAVIKYKEGFVFSSQYGGERFRTFSRSSDHLPGLFSDSETLHRMDQVSSRRDVPIVDAALCMFQS